MTSREQKALLRKIIVRFSFIPLFLGLLTLLPAGTFDYWQAYAYFAVLVVPMIFFLLYFIKKDPKFLERRTRVTEKEKQQKLIAILSAVVFLAGFIVPGFPVSLVLRILNEEKVLSDNLPGYKKYCRKTRFRLIPFMW